MEYRNIGKTFEDESVLLRRISELKQDNEYYVSQNLETCHQFHLGQEKGVRSQFGALGKFLELLILQQQ